MADHESTALLIGFLRSFTSLVEEQLLSVRVAMVDTVETVMKGVESISQATEDKKRQADTVLESVYINPDVETEVLIQDLQRVVDDLFDQSSRQLLQGEEVKSPLSTEPEVLVRNRINRLAGRFQDEMKSLAELDDELSNLIFSIIGTLSSEDVIAQKIDHVVMSLKALQTGLGYMLIDYENRSGPEDLNKIVTDIKELTFRQYTTEDEKERFRAHFGAEKKRA